MSMTRPMATRFHLPHQTDVAVSELQRGYTNSMDAFVAQMDCVRALEAMSSESVDLVVTDPAYESLEKHRATGTTTRLSQSKASSNAWFDIFHNVRYPALLGEMYRVMKPATHAYLFCDEETCDILKHFARQQGFFVWKSMLWIKVRESMPKLNPVGSTSELAKSLVRGGMGYHYRNASERILFLEKRSTKCLPLDGKPRGTGRKLNDLGQTDVLFAPRVKGYPTEKPTSILQTLIENSSVEGDLVLDPFAGSGSTGSVAMGLNRRFVGFDTADLAIQTMKERFNTPWVPGAPQAVLKDLECEACGANKGRTMKLYAIRRTRDGALFAGTNRLRTNLWTTDKERQRPEVWTSARDAELAAHHLVGQAEIVTFTSTDEGDEEETNA